MNHPMSEDEAENWEELDAIAVWMYIAAVAVVLCIVMAGLAFHRWLVG